MRALVRIILIQELCYGAFLAVLGLIIGAQHGLEIGLKVFIYGLVLFQLIIGWVNRTLIRAALGSNLEDDA